MKATLSDARKVSILLMLYFRFNEVKLRVMSQSGRFDGDYAKFLGLLESSRIMKEHIKGELNLNFLNSYLLEDEIYVQLDKLQALSALQTMLNNSETPATRAQYLYYSRTLEDQIDQLRELLDQLFF